MERIGLGAWAGVIYAMTDSPAGKALEGLRVLDLSRVLAGPLGGQILGDLGATVVKVERRGSGDPSRTMGAIVARNPAGAPTQSTFHQACNRNKLSLTVDFASAKGQQLIRKLACEADILIENYLPGTLKQYGLDYDTLSAINQRLIYCSVTGYGQEGPRRSQPGFDPVFQAETGIMAVTGEADGRPIKTGIYAVDELGGYNAAIGILAAVVERSRSGRGQHVDISLFDCGLAALTTVGQTYLHTGAEPGRHGNAGVAGGPSDTFACIDGLILLMGGLGNQFESICRILRIPDVAHDPRFLTSAGRFENRRELFDLLQAQIGKWKREELLAELSKASVPSGPVNTVGQAFADKHSVARGLIVETVQAGIGTVKSIANPVRLSRTPPTYDLAAPGLGEGQEEVLRGWLDLDSKEIEALAAEGAIGCEG